MADFPVIMVKCSIEVSYLFLFEALTGSHFYWKSCEINSHNLIVFDETRIKYSVYTVKNLKPYVFSPLITPVFKVNWDQHIMGAEDSITLIISDSVTSCLFRYNSRNTLKRSPTCYYCLCLYWLWLTRAINYPQNQYSSGSWRSYYMTDY